jgi:hypothetical protein
MTYTQIYSELLFRWVTHFYSNLREREIPECRVLRNEKLRELLVQATWCYCGSEVKVVMTGWECTYRTSYD